MRGDPVIAWPSQPGQDGVAALVITSDERAIGSRTEAEPSRAGGGLPAGRTKGLQARPEDRDDMLFARDLIVEEPLTLGTADLDQVARVGPGPPRPRRPLGSLPWLLAGALAAAIGLALHYRNDLAARLRPASPAAIRTAEVQSGIIECTIRLTGSTVAENSVLLRAPYLRGRRSAGGSGDFGLVLEELAAPGTQVKKNDLVAVFDRMPMLNRLDDRRAARVDRELRLRTMRAELDVKRVAYRQQIRVAKATMDTAVLDLKTAPVRSAIQVALFQLALEEATVTHEALLAQAKYVEAGQQAEIRLAQLELQEARVEERRAEANGEKMVVRAPVDGLVVVSQTFRGLELGQIQAGDQLRPGQPYVQIVDPGSMIVEASANQLDIEHLRIGARACVRLEAYSDLELPARVYSIGSLAKSHGWRANYVSEVPVFLKLDRLDPRLTPSLTVSADVILRREWSEGMVPREAVFLDAESGQPFAYVKTTSGWETRELELGLANNVDVAVRSGLNTGESVAVTEPSA